MDIETAVLRHFDEKREVMPIFVCGSATNVETVVLLS